MDEHQEASSQPAPDVTATSQPVPDEPTGRPRAGGTLATLLASVALSLCLTAVALYVYDLKIAQKLVVIDMNTFLNEQRSLLLAGKGAESDKRFDELEAKLSQLPANQVVLLKSVAVRNATEIKP